MYGYYWDSTMLLILPALIFSMWAQHKVKSTFAQYSQVSARKGVTAAQVARMLLDRFGLSNVPVNPVAGNLTDHYDPRDKTLSLSEPVFGSSSIAAIGVAAHEVGHAIQHSIDYRPLIIRNRIVPVVNIASNLAMPLFFIGILVNALGLTTLGIVLFTGAVVFHLVTLPVEFDASSRAIKILGETGELDAGELGGARKVLTAAALTYVAAALMSVLQLLRLIMIRNSRR